MIRRAFLVGCAVFFGAPILGLVLIAVLATCGSRPIGDQALQLSLVNNSQLPVRYYWQYGQQTDLIEGDVIAAHSAHTSHFMKSGPSLRILARTLGGVTVFDSTYLWSQLEEQEDRPVVIVVATGP